MYQLPVCRMLKVHKYFTCQIRVRYLDVICISCVEVTCFWALWLSVSEGAQTHTSDVKVGPFVDVGHGLSLPR